MMLVCQSEDTRLGGEDGDHVGTMKLSERSFTGFWNMDNTEVPASHVKREGRGGQWSLENEDVGN
jgi:hypothetical protein